ncbi:hypothetical protein O0L34_g3120 [Tuta absoluta]|nr:hypothetical protein O0L34_g3120 [Tuta absoluta]
MWKYVSRRIRDTFERSVNHFEKRSTAGVVNNAPGNVSEDKRSAPPSRWFCSRRCWNSTREDNDTNSNRWNFEQLNRSWIGAITWSSALVLGWYTSQLIHLRVKYSSRRPARECLAKRKLLSSIYPYIKSVNNNPVYLSSVSQIEKIIATFTPTVHLISNDDNREKRDGSISPGSSSTNPDTSDDDLGDVLNSIENKLGLAAIENGHLQDGLNLLRSAATRNHPPAIYNLGLCYELGLGVPVNEKTAMELYRSAAALEHPGALYNLGVFYGQGRGGLARDPERATRLLRLAAVQGQQDAIDALKYLDDPKEPPQPVAPDDDQWEYHCTPYNNSVLPSHTALFIENVNYYRVNHRASVH